MSRQRLGCLLVLVFGAVSCHLPTADDLKICKHATLQSRLSGPARLTHSADYKQYTLDFGVISGTQETATWTLVNPGSLDVTVLKVVDTTDPAWSVGVFKGQTVPANGQADLSVVFTPPSMGVFSHSLSIVTDACVLSSVGLTLKGAQVAPPALIPSDTLVDFGTVAARAQRTHTVTLSNVTDIDLEVQVGSLSGAGAPAFETFAKTLTVPALGSADLVIQFSPLTNPSASNEHFEAYLTVSYCLDGCTTVLNLQGDSYECLSVAPLSLGFDGGVGVAQQSINFSVNSSCAQPITVNVRPEFLNQLPDGGPSDGGPFGVDPSILGSGFPVYYNSQIWVTFAATDNQEHQGTLSLAYADPMPYALAIPLEGHASCLWVNGGTLGFQAYADGPKDAVTQSVRVQNVCPATSVGLTSDLELLNLLPDGGMVPAGPFQLGPGAPMTGIVLAPGATLEVPVVYAPTQIGYDQAEIEVATDEPLDSPTAFWVYGSGQGPSIYYQGYLDFTGSWGTPATRSVFVVNYSGDYPGHLPTLLGVTTDCAGMNAAIDAGLPAPIPYGQWYDIDATWSAPVCDGGECGCDGGYCSCGIYLKTSDLPPPVPILYVYY